VSKKKKNKTFSLLSSHSVEMILKKKRIKNGQLDIVHPIILIDEPYGTCTRLQSLQDPTGKT